MPIKPIYNIGPINEKSRLLVQVYNVNPKNINIVKQPAWTTKIH